MALNNIQPVLHLRMPIVSEALFYRHYPIQVTECEFLRKIFFIHLTPSHIIIMIIVINYLYLVQPAIFSIATTNPVNDNIIVSNLNIESFQMILHMKILYTLGHSDIGVTTAQQLKR